MTFGKNLKNLREKHGLSKPGLAAELGVSKAAVGQWEAGLTDPDNMKNINIEKLCILFNVSKNQLLGKKELGVSEATSEYNSSTAFDDMLSKAMNYVLDNAKGLSNEDLTIATRLLYNHVKTKGIILRSDLEHVLKLLH